MALEQNIRPVSLPAGEDLREHQYRFVKVGADSTIVKIGAAGEGIGVLQSASREGEAATVATEGVSFCVAGGKINSGDLVTSAASGKAVVAGEGDAVKGTAFSDASGDGAVFSVAVNVPSGHVPSGG